MRERLEKALEQLVNLLRHMLEAVAKVVPALGRTLMRWRAAIIAAAAVTATGCAVYRSPPVQTVAPGEMGIRTNRLTGSATAFREGDVIVLPVLHKLKQYSLRDHTHETDTAAAGVAAPLPSSEGVPLGVVVDVRYALDPETLASVSERLPQELDTEIVRPAVLGALQKVFARHTVKEIFATQHARVQAEVEEELKPKLAHDAILVRAVQLGTVDLLVPGEHEVRRYPLRDQIYHPEASARARGPAPFQTIEGLSVGVDLGVRYTLDLDQLAAVAPGLPDDIGTQLVQPAVHGVIYKVFARYTVKEIFSTKRAEIQQAIEAELKPYLAKDGIVLRAVQVGNVDLPGEYRQGMEQALSEELATEKMKHTLVLKDQQVKQSELEANAQKVARERAAEAAANEQVIAAKAQEEAMKHIIPFKQKQIEQTRLEAEANKLARVRQAQANAEARRIEAAGEADSRKKLADADAYRLDNLGKIESAQLARDGETVSKHPLIIQKTMADKLSDNVSVIIAAPPANGSFIGSTLLGQGAKPDHAGDGN